MDLRESAADRDFRASVREWLEGNLSGEFAEARGLGGPGREHEAVDVRVAWERHLGAAGWTCLGWPKEYGGRDLSLLQQVIFYEEYARAGARAGSGSIGEGCSGRPCSLRHRRRRRSASCRRSCAASELWCQGYSEPDAGSDLANV